MLVLYYIVKPLIPRSLQIGIRRALSASKRNHFKDIWPIDPKTSKAPAGWIGWPDQKKFAFVLTHDVDTSKGLAHCARLMNLEEQLGFKSSFFFVPEDYKVPESLRSIMEEAGFEVGIHGLTHDGKLFQNRRVFENCARRINYYLRAWNAVGFRSPSMHSDLDWIAELDIEYDASTFDIDPFEPYAHGIGTIFPLWISSRSQERGYVELPYTLPQDHCLFVILKEKDINIWKTKLDWIAYHGGMVLLNTHPDYMNFENDHCALEEYPARFYRAFLEYVKTKHAGSYWNALPRDVARFWHTFIAGKTGLDASKKNEEEPKPLIHRNPLPTGTPKLSINIWIDLDNTPHVPFFRPIIRELEHRGHTVCLTARDEAQVCELAEKYGMHFIQVGHHYGKNLFKKVIGTILRSFKLMTHIKRMRPNLALSHGSRSQVLLSKLLGIPSIVAFDYEHSRTLPFLHSRWGIIPEFLSLSNATFHHKNKRVRSYRGIKEDVYVPEFNPDPLLPKELGIHPEKIVIAVRPPANEAHYRNPESDILLDELMLRLSQTPQSQVVLLPRSREQEQLMKNKHPEWFTADKIIIPPQAVDGLSLLWLSDLVVSGGGTMNREAAALGVPVFSIFKGKTGAVDRMLEKEGRLTLIRNTEEIWTKIHIGRRDKSRPPDRQPRAALGDIIAHIEEIIRIECSSSQ